jgi:hypothetical protein
MYGEKVNPDLIEDLIRRYFFVRQKIFRLEMSWKKFMMAPDSPGQKSIPSGSRQR